MLHRSPHHGGLAPLRQRNARPVVALKRKPIVRRIVAFAPWAIARTRLVIVARASWSWAAGYRSSASMSVKAGRSSWPEGVNSYPLPCDERSKYSVPRNVTLAVAGD